MCCDACKKVTFHVPSVLEADTLVGRGEKLQVPIVAVKHGLFSRDAVNTAGVFFLFNGMNG